MLIKGTCIWTFSIFKLLGEFLMGESCNEFSSIFIDQILCIIIIQIDQKWQNILSIVSRLESTSISMK